MSDRQRHNPSPLENLASQPEAVRNAALELVFDGLSPTPPITPNERRALTQVVQRAMTGRATALIGNVALGTGGRTLARVLGGANVPQQALEIINAAERIVEGRFVAAWTREIAGRNAALGREIQRILLSRDPAAAMEARAAELRKVLGKRYDQARRRVQVFAQSPARTPADPAAVAELIERWRRGPWRRSWMSFGGGSRRPATPVHTDIEGRSTKAETRYVRGILRSAPATAADAPSEAADEVAPTPTAARAEGDIGQRPDTVRGTFPPIESMSPQEVDAEFEAWLRALRE